MTMLDVIDLETGYGAKQVINGITLKVQQGEMVALVGHNGSGKSTLLKAIFGLLKVWQGKILYEGKEIQNRSPLENIREGIGFVPQGNRVFTELTVWENLEMGGYTLNDHTLLRDRIEQVFDLFPVLRGRARQIAGTLSGGEQQMLALANALILSPKLLLLDEPSLGLSPGLVNKAFEKIVEVNKRLETTILIVEQKVKKILGLADRVYILKMGKVIHEGPAKELLEGDRIHQVYL